MQQLLDKVGKSSPHWKSDGVVEEDGKGSYRVPVRALNIVWGNDHRYWQWHKLTNNEARLTGGFQEGALLVQVNWIEVTAELDASLFRKNDAQKRYQIFYVVKFRGDAFGWHGAPIKFKVTTDGQEREHRVSLQPYRAKEEAWHEIPGGAFSISKGTGTIEFGMFEVDSNWWKGSMVLAGVKIKAL